MSSTEVASPAIPGSAQEVLLARSVEAFLFCEARCLDEQRYRDWLSLWADDGIYWAPMAHPDPNQGLSLIYEDVTRLRDRVEVMLSKTAYPQEPASETAHLVTNVEVTTASEDGPIVARSAFSIVEMRRSTQTVYAGRYTHHLRRDDSDTIRIVQKKIDLVGASGVIGNLSFLL